jgi:hypothetical protein
MVNVYTKASFDFDNLPWLTSPRKPLDLEAVALGLIKIPPNDGYTFTHQHEKQEEVYVVVEGEGVILIESELIDIKRGNIIRVSASAKRALKANETGLFVICAGGIPMGYPKNPNARYLIDDGIPDYDDIPPWFKGAADVAQKNAELKKRMIKARQRRD